MDWLKWFNFPYDPFFDKPLETDSELESLMVIARTLQETISGFTSQIQKIPQICLIAGERGVGKSTVMYYAAKLLGKEGGFPVYIGLHHSQVDASSNPVDEIKRDLLESISVEIIRCLSSHHHGFFERSKRRLIGLMEYLGYSFDPSAGFLPDITPVHLSIPDLEKHILELTSFVKNLGLDLLLMVDNLDKVKKIESVQTFLGSAFGQTFFENLRKRGASIIFAVAPRFLEIQKKDRDLNYLSRRISIPILVPNQAIDLIEKRIKHCKSPSPRNPLTRRAIIHICLSKRGITRDILTEARNLCMSAGNLEVSQVNKEFVESGLVSFNPNRAFYDLMDSSEAIKDYMMQLLDLQTLLNPDECVQAGSALQSIAKGEVTKMSNTVHAALLSSEIIIQKPGEKRKYTFTSQIEQLLKACEKKGWSRIEFLRWITTTEGHKVAVTGTPVISASRSLEGFGPILEPTRSVVQIRERGTERDFPAEELMRDAEERLRLAKKTMSRIGRLSWDDIDSKTVYIDLYSSLINFLIAFSKLYLTRVSKNTPRVRSAQKFDLIQATVNILQEETGRSIASWHRILRLKANMLGLREGQFSPSHADLKAALDDFEEILNELSSLWREILSEQEIVPKPIDKRMQDAITKLSKIASILRYSSERPEYMSVEVDGEEEYRVGFLPYPTNKVTFDVVREKQIKDAEGKVRSSFLIACVHDIQKGRARSKDILGFFDKCKYLVNLIESKEESLSTYWPRYYLVFVSLMGFERGVTATLTASEKPPESKVTLLSAYRLDGLVNDLESTIKLGRAEGEFEELSSRSLEDLLRLRIKATDAIRDKHRKETTILLADLKEFTRRTEEDSLESAEAVQRLSDIFDKNVKANGGEGTQTEGDSYIACFDQTENAITAALSALEELETYNRTVDRKRQIQVRIGINSGFAFFKKGQPFVGSVVNLASRTMREVEAGKIAITYWTKKKIKSQKGFRLRSLGSKILKGFERPVDLYEVQRVNAPK